MSKKKLSVLSFVSATLLFSAVVGAPAKAALTLPEVKNCVLKCNESMQITVNGGILTDRVTVDLASCHTDCLQQMPVCSNSK